MAKILVVDDSDMDRRLVKGLLEEDTDLQLEFAVDGQDALTRMKADAPSLVITDLMMPVMDGMELVTNARQQFPLIPVILMTSLGSEEIASQALRLGAASYVPKRLLAENLQDTVRKVLAVAVRERNYARVLDCMTAHRSAFVLDNDFSLISHLVGYFQDGLGRMGICDDSDRMRVGVALEEALANAIYHGNLEVASHLREDDDRAYYALAEERRQEPPYQQRRVHFDVDLSPERAVFVVRDDGPGFDPSALPDPTDPANLDKVSGRGVLLMRTFMDEVVFNAKGNQVTLTKRRSVPGDE